MKILIEAETGYPMVPLSDIPADRQKDFARWRCWLPSVHGDLEPPHGWCWLEDYLMFVRCACGAR